MVTYPVSIGKMDWQTPMGLTHVVSKEKNPTWNPPASVRAEHLANNDPLPAGVIKAGPDNPLGLFAMRLAIHPGDYLIHGTNNPLAVGMAVTHGCIRMYPEDVAAIFPTVPVGTKVYLINVPLKVAFVDGDLLLEAHPPVDAQGQSVEPVLDKFEDLLNQVLGNTTAAVNWDIAVATLKKADGIPVLVGLQADVTPPSPGSAPPAAPAESSAPAASSAPAQTPPRLSALRRQPLGHAVDLNERCSVVIRPPTAVNVAPRAHWQDGLPASLTYLGLDRIDGIWQAGQSALRTNS